jgi:thymidylate synthase (FAD)
MKIWDAPRVSLLATQRFMLPDHIDWDMGMERNEEGETLSEFAGRLCYMSFGAGEIDGHKSVKGRTDQQEYFENVLKTKHGSVLEHAVWTFLFEGVSRSFTHELVRHRAGFGFSQLSQRFVNESDVGFVIPPLIQETTHTNPNIRNAWEYSCARALEDYKAILESLEKHQTLKGRTIQQKRIREAARSVLPNCTETKIVVTANARSWRHFIEMRGSPMADLEMIRLTTEVADVLKRVAPAIFQDVEFLSGNGVGVLHSKV